jgi:Protein of unknown function (DUF2628)
MAIYTVHLPPDAITADAVADKAVFVKEGFALFGFAFTGLWLLIQRLWLEAIGYALVFALVGLAFWQLGLPRIAFGGITALMALLVGLEGHEWMRRKYARLGWTHAATVSGPSLEECERRFFKDWTAAQGLKTPAPPRSADTPSTFPPPQPAGVLGVFPASRGQA